MGTDATAALKTAATRRAVIDPRFRTYRATRLRASGFKPTPPAKWGIITSLGTEGSTSHRPGADWAHKFTLVRTEALSGSG